MRMKSVKAAVFVAILFLSGLAGLVVSRVSLSALEEPGRPETYLATRGKRFLIGRASRDSPLEPAASPANIAEGEKLFGAECAMCHGLDGAKPTDTGRWMYPRAADLTSPNVQLYADAELFWIIKNGIRLSGMPAFGNVEGDPHIWQLVQYVRSLRLGKYSSH